MATKYVVLQEDGTIGDLPGYVVVTDVEAPSAEVARRKAAETMSEHEVERGVTLIAVPERNWRTGRGTLKAETTRRIRST